MLFSLFYGYAAARNRTARTVLMPLLDDAAECAYPFIPCRLFCSVSAPFYLKHLPPSLRLSCLSFTSQAWNMTFSFYQSMTTIPTEMREAAAVFRFDPWLRFKAVELPFAAIGLLWNSMMSWSGGWFFLMAAEIFNVGSRDFRLPGLGSYLQTAANEGNLHAVVLGVATLVVVIVLLDQLCLAPTYRLDRSDSKSDMVEGDEPPRSWFLDLISRAWLVEQFGTRIWRPFSEWVDRGFQRRTSGVIASPEPSAEAGHSRLAIGILTAFLACGFIRRLSGSNLLVTLPGSAWADLGKGIVATFLRVSVALGDYFDLDHSGRRVYRNATAVLRRFSSQSCKLVASIPATALFPVVLLALLQVAGRFEHRRCAPHVDGNAVVFAIQCNRGCGGYSAKICVYTTDLLRLSSLDRWRTSDLARALSIHHHRSHHGERRRLECKYRG